MIHRNTPPHTDTAGPNDPSSRTHTPTPQDPTPSRVVDDPTRRTRRVMDDPTPQDPTRHGRPDPPWTPTPQCHSHSPRPRPDGIPRPLAYLTTSSQTVNVLATSTTSSQTVNVPAPSTTSSQTVLAEPGGAVQRSTRPSRRSSPPIWVVPSRGAGAAGLWHLLWSRLRLSPTASSHRGSARIPPTACYRGSARRLPGGAH